MATMAVTYPNQNGGNSGKQGGGFWKGFLIGAGVGALAGCGGGFFYARKKIMQQAEKDLRRMRAKTRRYQQEVEQTFNEMQEALYIQKEQLDELKSLTDNMIVIDTENPNEALAKVGNYIEETNKKLEKDASVDASKCPSKPPVSSNEEDIKNWSVEADRPISEPSKGLPEANNDDGDENDDPDVSWAHEDYIVECKDGEKISYPEWIFFDENGGSLDDIRVRTNLLGYEPDQHKLRKVWEYMGWGEYRAYPSDDALDKIINDDAALIENAGEDVNKEERKEYVKEAERYLNNPNAGPNYITRIAFERARTMQGIKPMIVTWWEGDNIFSNDLDDSEIDATELLGENNGKLLFANKPKFIDDEDNDPDVVLLRNFKMNALIEVTRKKASYVNFVNGSAIVGSDEDVL